MNQPLPILLLAGLGVLIGASVLYAKIRTKRILAMMLILIGAGMTVVGANPAMWEQSLSPRSRLIMLGTSLGILYITFTCLRRTMLRERYALLWLGTSAAFFLLGLYPDVLLGLLNKSGMQYTSAIMVLVFLFLLLITFHFSLAMSKNEDERRKLTQETALLRNRVEHLEKQMLREKPDAEALDESN